MDQNHSGTASYSGAVNINAKDATPSSVCLYTKGKIPIECIYSVGFSGYIQTIKHCTFVFLVSEKKLCC